MGSSDAEKRDKGNAFQSFSQPAPVTAKPAIGGGVKPVAVAGGASKPVAKPVGLMKDGDDADDGGDYDEDEFDEDEEENFKKTAADFQKKLTELKNQNAKRNNEVKGLAQGGFQLKGNDSDNYEDDDDFEEEKKNAAPAKPAAQGRRAVPPQQSSSVVQEGNGLNNRQQSKPFNQRQNNIMAPPTKKEINEQRGESNYGSPSQSLVSKSKARNLDGSPVPSSMGDKYLKKLEERNPYKFIERALVEAQAKIEKMKGTDHMIDSLQDVSRTRLLVE